MAQRCLFFLCENFENVIKFFTLILTALLAFTGGYAQTTMLAASVNQAATDPEDKETGIVQGSIQTTDNQPAAYVTVTLKGFNRSTFTNENGTYILKNIKPGQYTLLATMS